MALDRPRAGPTRVPPPRGWRRHSGTRGRPTGTSQSTPLPASCCRSVPPKPPHCTESHAAASAKRPSARNASTSDEKTAILAVARSLNIAAAHYVGAVVMAHVHGDLALPGQRTQLDDYIDELTALRSEVAKIGHNVNQIAKKLNSDGRPHHGDTALLDHAERVLGTVGTAVRHIAAATNQAAATKGTR